MSRMELGESRYKGRNEGEAEARGERKEF